MPTDIFLEDVESIFDSRVAKADIELTEALASYYESCIESLMYEEAGDSLGVKINKFIGNMVAAVTQFISSIKLQVNTMIQSSNYQKNLRELHKKLKESKEKGSKTVKVQDVWTLRDVYMDGVERLRKYAKKFANMNYKTTAKLEEDLEKFNQIYDEVENKAEKVMDSTVIVSIDKMLAFIDAECSGNGRVLKTLEEYTIEFKEMGNAAKALTKKADILGPDIIQKHVGFIKRIGMKIANFMKRIIVKIVTTCCLWIG